MKGSDEATVEKGWEEREEGRDDSVPVAGDGGGEEGDDAGGCAEGLFNDGAGDVGDEDMVGGGEEAGVLRREGVEGDGGLIADVELEVREAAGKHGDVTHLQRGREQHVVLGDEPRVDGALEHRQRLRRARMRVHRHHAADGEVQTRV